MDGSFPQFMGCGFSHVRKHVFLPEFPENLPTKRTHSSYFYENKMLKSMRRKLFKKLFKGRYDNEDSWIDYLEFINNLIL